MPIRAAQRFTSNLWHREPWWAEWIHAWGILIWALLVYGSTADMAERPNMILLRWLPDELWAALGVGIWLAQISMLIIDRRLGRWLVSSISLWLWVSVIISLLATSYFATPQAVIPLSLAAYSIPLMTCVLSVLRLLRA